MNAQQTRGVFLFVLLSVLCVAVFLLSSTSVQARRGRFAKLRATAAAAARPHKHVVAHHPRIHPRHHVHRVHQHVAQHIGGRKSRSRRHPVKAIVDKIVRIGRKRRGRKNKKGGEEQPNNNNNNEQPPNEEQPPQEQPPQQVPVPATTMKKCQAIGDPHYTNFQGQYYDFYGVGDYILASSKDGNFIVHSRTGRWGSVSVNTAFAVKVNDRNVIEYDVESNSFYVNGHKTEIPIGEEMTFGMGAVAKRSAENTMTVSAKDGAHLIATWYRNPSWKSSQGSFGHISLVVEAPTNLEFNAGLCVDKSFMSQTATGLLHNHIERKITRSHKPRKPTKEEVKAAVKVCNKAGLKGKKHPLALRACVADQVQTGSKVGKSIAKVIKQVERIADRKQKKWNRKAKKATRKQKRRSSSKRGSRKQKRRSSSRRAGRKQRKQKRRSGKRQGRRPRRSSSRRHAPRKQRKQNRGKKITDRRTRRIQRRAARSAARRARRAQRDAKRRQRRARRAARRAAKRASRQARKAARKQKRARRARRTARKQKRAAKKARKNARKLAKKRARKQKRLQRKLAKKAKKIARKNRRLAKKAKKTARKIARRASKKARRRINRKKRSLIRKTRRQTRKLSRAARKAQRRARKLARRARKLFKIALKKGSRKAIARAKCARRVARKARRAARKLSRSLSKAQRKVKRQVRRIKKLAKRALKKSVKKAAKVAKKRYLRRVAYRNKVKAQVARASSTIVQRRTVKKIRALLRKAAAIRRRLGKKFNPSKHLPKRLLLLIKKLKLSLKCAVRRKKGHKITTLGSKLVKKLIRVAKCARK